MRALLVLSLSGCSLLYDGSDLRGKAAGRPAWKTSTYTAGMGATDVAVGDIDGDGKLDIAVASRDDSSIVVFLGTGDGNFTPAGATDAGCTGPHTLALIDLNRDHKADVVVVCNDDTVSTTEGRVLLAGDGGQLNTAVPFDPKGVGDTTALATDLDRDGDVDLLLAHQGSGTLVTLFGPALTRTTSVHSGNGAYELAVGDLDGDGQPDVAVSNPGDGTVSTFQAGGGVVAVYPTDDQPWGVAIADFDGKNGPDLATATYGLALLDISLNQGGGAFPASRPKSIDMPVSPNKLRAADFDRDGHMDLVAGAYVDTLVAFFYGNGDGTFQDTVTVEATSASGMVVADLDGDGKSDIVISEDNTPGSITVLMNR